MMFKFKGSKSQQLNTESVKTVEDYMDFSRIATLGFPYKPSALAWDPYLSLFGIGTQYGCIQIYGAPGVQFCAQHKQKICIVDLIFISRKVSLISLCSDNSLHLWELSRKNGTWSLEEKKSFLLGGLMKKITALFLSEVEGVLFMGTMCGNTYTLNIETFEMAESVIYQDVVVQNVPDDKLKQGAVKIILAQPHSPECLLIGYQYGLIALWNTQKLVVVNTFISSQNLEYVTWHRNGLNFMSSYSDGSYITWSILDSSKPIEVPMTPYGPFPCKSIHKILWLSVKGSEDYIIFSGGMPKSSYGDKFTVTIMCGERHQVLDLSSKMINFFTISDTFEESEFDNQHSLLILLEEELIAIDLESDEWLPFKLPYLEIIHSSPVTCFQYCPNVHRDMWNQMKNLSQEKTAKMYSENVWPVKGGHFIPDSNLVNNIIVTGHENGSIKIWNVSFCSLQLIYALDTSEIFIMSSGEEESDNSTEWPPFRKVGSFDPLFDDHRLAIRKIILNDVSCTLIAGGAAGQIIVLQLLNVESRKETIVSHVTIGDKWDSSLWCNPQPLIVKHGKQTYERGLHVQCVVQLTPPASITSLTFYAEWNLFAAGIPHGFLVYDVVQKKCIMSRYTLNISENIVIVGNISPKTKSLKKTFRDSFRKLKITKSKSLKRERGGSLSSDIQEVSRENSIKRESFASSPDPTLVSSPSPEHSSFDTESQCTTDAINSVQCVYFAQSFIINNVITTPTLWVGTSNGSIYIYTITMPTTGCRTSDPVVCQLGKEIQLKHQAPVLAIQIIDYQGYPLPDPNDVQIQRMKTADPSGLHKVLICTEEQIKVLTLPNLKPVCKNKITLMEGYHIDKVGFVTFPNKNDPKLCEHCAVCLSSLKGIILYSLPDLKWSTSFSYSSLEDINKTYFSSNGFLVCLKSPSEFEMVSLSAYSSMMMKSSCKLDIPKKARKPLEEIVLNMQSVKSQIGYETNEDSFVQNALNLEQEQQMSSAHHESTDLDDERNISEPHQNNIEQQCKRAPLATIEELNTSGECPFLQGEVNVTV